MENQGEIKQEEAPKQANNPPEAQEGKKSFEQIFEFQDESRWQFYGTLAAGAILVIAIVVGGYYLFTSIRDRATSQKQVSTTSGQQASQGTSVTPYPTLEAEVSLTPSQLSAVQVPTKGATKTLPQTGPNVLWFVLPLAGLPLGLKLFAFRQA